ncbi:MAG: hypothetical protein LUD29_06175 [Clostridia bacterium]|nr:hypothetical protein [Clostridia bacterium]
MLRKKLYGFFAFLLVIACALGLTFALSACSNDKDSDLDPIIGTWEGTVEFSATLGNFPLGTMSADTTIIVDENTFSLLVTIDIMGFSFENYMAIEDAEWEKTENENEYMATAYLSEDPTYIPIVLIDNGKGNYELSLTTSVTLYIQGLSITATFEDARVSKVSNDTTKPEDKGSSPNDTNDETSCTCDDECTCGDDCECDGTCSCENCGTGEDEGDCTCDDECACGDGCECGDSCGCENCGTEGDEEGCTCDDGCACGEDCECECEDGCECGECVSKSGDNG